MKVLLINPPVLIGDIAFLGKQYPLSLMILAAYLRTHGFPEVKIWDANAEGFTEAELERRLNEWPPDAVGLTAFTSTINNAAHIARLVKRLRPEAATVVGGVHPSVLPERTLREYAEFDHLVFGEGEATFVELLQALHDRRPLTAVPGLCRRAGGEVLMNPPRELIENIDEIPFPARDLIPHHLYRSNATRNVLSQPAAVDSLITARGCMGLCTFCAARSVFTGKVRYRSVENVIAEIDECRREYGTEHFWIMDETFTTSKIRLRAICEAFKRHGVTWNCTGRVDLVDEEKIRMMAESGCTGIQFGVESGSQRILDLMKKGITVEQIRRAFAWANRCGITADAPVILGSHPSETMEDIRMTERLIREIKPQTFACSILIPFPGTEIRRIMEEKGYIKNEKWEDYVFIGGKAPPFRTDHFTYDELRKIQKRLLTRFYLRPSYLWRRLLAIRSGRELKYWARVGVDFVRKIALRGGDKEYKSLGMGKG